MIDTSLARELREYCEAQRPRMLELLERVVRINSHTWNKQGSDAVADVFAGELEARGLEVQRVAHREVGDTLVARTPAAVRPEAGQILFCGHMDTVFPEEMGFSCFERQGGTIRGPGVIDMKGGLVAALFAIEALQKAGVFDSIPLIFLLNADEEVGSPHSTPLIQEQARHSSFAFVFECSGLQGQVVTARKGRHGFTLTCAGRAGHVGQAGADKPSAILELAHKIIAIESLNALERGLTCNVGRVGGGTGPNTVPESATAEVDCRFVSREDAEAVRHAVEDVAARQTVPGVHTHLETVGQRPPMEAAQGNRALFAILRELGQRMDVAVLEEARGGVSDANTIADLGVPVLDGLGPSGDRDHSSDEYMLADSLPQRTALAAAGALACWERFGTK